MSLKSWIIKFSKQEIKMQHSAAVQRELQPAESETDGSLVDIANIFDSCISWQEKYIRCVNEPRQEMRLFS